MKWKVTIKATKCGQEYIDKLVWSKVLSVFIILIDILLYVSLFVELYGYL
jgi:hypothetical protein